MEQYAYDPLWLKVASTAAWPSTLRPAGGLLLPSGTLPALRLPRAVTH